MAAPAKIFGDVHGRLGGLFLLFLTYGIPTTCQRPMIAGTVLLSNYIFNGHWVDRGAHQIDTLLILSTNKCCYLDRLLLVRGNHEDNGALNESECDGFFKQCEPYGR